MHSFPFPYYIPIQMRIKATISTATIHRAIKQPSFSLFDILINWLINY